MEPVLLLMAGAAVALYCLGQLRRWLRDAESAAAAGPQRLESLIDELLATAETTTAMVQEKAEVLAIAIAEADKRLGALGAQPGAADNPAVAAMSLPDRSAAAPPPELSAPEPPPEAPEAAPAPEPDQPELHRAVYALADAGADITNIARRLGLTKGEVQLILGLRQAQRSGGAGEARPC